MLADLTPRAEAMPAWCCPRCRSALADVGDVLACGDCAARYETVDGIPDLRIASESWGDFEEDLAIARDLAAQPDLPLPELVHSVYSRRPGWDEARVSLRTQQVLDAPSKLRPQASGWLADHMMRDRIVLDLGCGAGALLAAAAERGARGIGVDISMTWLVIAKRMIAAFGGTPRLAAALGEALPLPPRSVHAVVSLDVIEHVRDPAAYLAEINRVTRPGGLLALSTPNRFSLAPEPHVFVWGVGWLPRRWQNTYVHWRSGQSYDGTCLLSSFDLHNMLKSNTQFAYTIVVPDVAAEDIQHFGPVKAAIARCYNAVRRWRALRWFFLLCGPFFRIVGERRAD